MSLVATLLTSLLGGAAAAALFNAWLQHRRAEGEKTDARIYLARVLAFAFEAYAMACAEALSEAEPDNREMHEPGKTPSLPEPPTLAQSPAYQWMDPILLERIFAFPQDIAATRRSLSYLWLIADPDDFDAEATRELATFGLNAAALAADLRAAHGISTRRLGTRSWNIVDYLDKKRSPPV